MKSPLKKLITLAAVFFAVALTVIVINQTLQLVDFAERIDPVFGLIVFWGLTLVYVVCLAMPVWIYFRLPGPLKPPPSEQHADFSGYLQKLARRLAKNPRLIGVQLSDESGVNRDYIDAALERLDEQAMDITRQTAGKVFLSTAISQNGSLDALIVLWVQSKLVLEIAKLYNQRPSLRELANLYANVAATAFIARELDEADLSEQVQPVLSSVLGSAAGAVPGLQVASNLFVNSVTSGSANAFLSLRVGIIAQQYCRGMIQPERAMIRKSATLGALKLLAAIVASGAAEISSVIVKASTRGVTGAVTGAVSGVGNKVKDAGSAVAEKIPFWKRKEKYPEE